MPLSTRPGRACIISLWATWCPACHKELPGFAVAQSLYARERVDLIAINVDDAPLDEVLARSGDIDLGSLPALFDRAGATISAPLADGQRSPLQMLAMPLAFVSDRSGLVRGYVKGSIDWQMPECVRGVRSLI